MLSKLTSSFKSNIVTGLLVLTPIGAVFWIMVWLWNFLFVLADLIPLSLRPTSWLGIDSGFASAFMEFLLTIIILFLVLGFIWSVGVISRYYIGRKLLEYLSAFMERVPVFRSIYSTIQQLIGTFTSSKSKNFRRVVMVEYPRNGMYTLAFVTGERSLSADERLLNIFVPTTPNPTSGFYLSVAEKEVKHLNISVEEALKEILSLGLVQKSNMK